MRPKIHSVRVVVSLLASALLLTAIFLPITNRAAELVLLGITVSPANKTIEVGQTQQFTATADFDNGSTLPLSGSSGLWSATGSLAAARYYHTATRLPDGSVLVAGGYDNVTSLRSAERYNPATGQWTSAGNMAVARAAHTATLLPNGKVLVIGGINFATSGVTSTTELYDPITNSWSAGAILFHGARAFHSAVLLNSGKVLVAAGVRQWPDCAYRTESELYDPATNFFQNTGPLVVARSNATTALLANGNVLLAGGPSNGCPTPNHGMTEAEIYNAATGLWSATGSLSRTRYTNFIAALPGGKVLLAGGTTTNAATTATTDMFDPATATFSAGASMASARATSGGTGDNGTAVVLSDGRVMIPGGHNNTAGTIASSVELFDPSTAAWSMAAPLLTARTHNTTTMLPNGSVLVTGGHGSGGVPLASAEIYFPQAIWSSSDTSVATIDQKGKAIAVGLGTTTISVSSGSITGSTLLTVDEDRVAPATTAAYPAPNENGWHDTDVIVQLDAADSGGPVSASGVASISYSLSGAQSGGGSISGSSVSFAVSNEGMTAITYQAVDHNGNVETPLTLVIKIDRGRPLLSYPDQITAVASSAAGAVVNFVVSASDNGSGVVGGVTVSPKQSGDTFPIGTTTETVTATDAAGNTATATFDVIVSPGDTTPPTTSANLPAPNANGWNRFDVFVSLNAFDESSNGSPAGVKSITYSLSGAQTGNFTVMGNFASFTISNEGTTTVNYFATDNRDNVEGVKSFTVSLDKTPPTAANLGNIQAAATSTSGAVVHFDLAAADALSGIDTAAVTQGLPSGSTFPHGTTNEAATITDRAGNTAFRNFSVTVNKSLLSIAVAPSAASILVGDSQSFQAIGHFTSGPDQVLPSGGGGGGGAPTLSGGHWHIQAPPSDAINVSACGAGVGPYTSQPFSAVNGTAPAMFGDVHTTWGNPAAVRADGVVTAQEVHLTLSCVVNNGATGSIDATWTGTRFEGTWAFSGSSGSLKILGWSTKASLPTPRFSLGAAAVNGIVYAIGGNDPSMPSPVEAYDPATNSWSTVSQLPIAVEGAAVVALNNIIYVAGGHVTGGNSTGALQAYDPIKDVWLSDLASMSSARAHLSLVAASGKLYAIGGDTGGANGPATSVVEQYDPIANSWTARAPMSRPRSFLAAGALNGDSVIVAAGGDSGAGTTELYNVATNSWSPGPAMVNSGGRPAAVVVNNAMFVFGINGNAVHMFRPTGTQPTGWAGMAPMPTSRGQLAVAAVGDVVYAIGGRLTGGSVPTAAVEAFSAPLPANFSVTSGGGGSNLPTVTWSTSDPSIAQVNAFGIGTGEAQGQATIIATAAGISCAATNGCATLTVTQPTHITFTLAPGSQPFNMVTVTIVDRVMGTPVATFDIPIGEPQEVSVEDADQIRILIAAPPGYSVSPSEVEPNLHNGDINIPLLFTVADSTPPVLSLPGAITVDATGPQGATVSYAATASDAVDGDVAVTCLPPSGATFPIGTTTVECSATDAAGNTASGAFTVLVQAAAAQVSQLIVNVQSFNLQQGISNSLDAKLTNVLNALSGATAGNTTAVCNQLGAFINETMAQSGKKLTVAQANALIAAAQQIQAVIGCQ